jgi:hypothetical protein
MFGRCTRFTLVRVVHNDVHCCVVVHTAHVVFFSGVLSRTSQCLPPPLATYEHTHTPLAEEMVNRSGSMNQQLEADLKELAVVLCLGAKEAGEVCKDICVDVCI